MEQRTRDHLRTAEANEAFARSILEQGQPMPVSVNWAVVAAFYAAVHDVNAYLWETARLEPKHHTDRENVMELWPALNPMLGSYLKLKDYSINARYSPGFQASPKRLEGLLDKQLTRINREIRAHLGQ